jgi:GxxExxY protein
VPLCLCGENELKVTNDDPLTESVIGAAIEVHRALGPGLLESAYQECLCHELNLLGLSFERERPLPVLYKGVRLDCGYRLDLVVEGRVIVEVKTVERLCPSTKRSSLLISGSHKSTRGYSSISTFRHCGRGLNAWYFEPQRDICKGVFNTETHGHGENRS